MLSHMLSQVRIRLMPEWSETSVEFVRHLAQSPELCTTACEFYRAEPGFLLQVCSLTHTGWESLRSVHKMAQYCPLPEPDTRSKLVSWENLTFGLKVDLVFGIHVAVRQAPVCMVPQVDMRYL